MQINNVVMAGRLVDNVKYQSTKNGTPLSTFKLANNQGKHTNYFRIASFGKVADYANNYLTKSERVTIVGRLNHHEHKDENGNWHDYYTIIANTFDAISRKSSKQSKTDRDLEAKYNDLNKKIDKISKQSQSKKVVSK